MLVPRKRPPRDGGLRMFRLAGAAVPASVLGVLAAVAVTACGSSAAPAGQAATGRPSASASASASGSVASGESGLCAATMKVDSLMVQRTDALPGNHTRFSFPATDNVRSAPAAQAVAQSLCGLQPVPRKTVVCPADFGVTYHLSFAAGSQRFAPVTVNAGGCELVSGLGPVRRVTTSATLWRTLGIAIGLPHPGSAAFSGTSSTS
jgi:hypothetical protein